MKVAVIIPCFNVAAHVEKALRSVLAQTHRDLDVVLVDDGSTDGTRAVIEQVMAEGDGRIRLITQANAGACAARNAGVAASQGDWIQFLDADDVLLPDKLAEQMKLAGSDKQVVVGGYRDHQVDGRVGPVVLPLLGDPWEALVRTRMGTTSANLFQRDALLRAGGWDPTLRSSQDYELLFRLLKEGASIVWDASLRCEVLKRTKGSISRTDEKANWQRYLQLRKDIRDHLSQDRGRDRSAVIATADQYLFMAIRVLSKHDRQAAFKAFDELLPRGFVPEKGVATTASYVFVFRLFGFRVAEALAGLKPSSA